MKRDPVASNDYEGAEVRLCEDGKYRWKYELNMITNPVIMITVFKVFFFIIIGMALVFGTIFLISDGNWNGVIGMFKAMGIVLGIFAVLTFLGTALLSLVYGGKYVVLFEMDDKGIVHIQMPAQQQKARKLGILTFFVGLFAKRPTTMGAGLLSTTKNASASEFKKVRRVRSRRWLHTIKVNQLFERNQVYVPDDDYDFVYDFIKSHCPNLK
jgi:hypothetical protein